MVRSSHDEKVIAVVVNATSSDLRVATVTEGGDRLDRFAAGAFPELSRAHAQKLIDEGRLLINGRRAKASQRLEAGDAVSLELPPPEPVALEPEDLPLDVVFEDSDLIVVNKPAGLTVHPAPGHPNGTLVNALLAHCGDLAGIGGSLRPGIVHRLDKDTSGLLVVAKNDLAQRALSGQLARHEMHKVYLALVTGTPPRTGVVDAPIGRHPAQRKRMAVVSEGRPARSHLRLVEQFKDSALVAVALETGRTHQIRVHLAAIGHPVIGDPVYGAASPLVGRQFLHAWRLEFAHPRDRRRMELEAPLPADLRTPLERLAAGRTPLERMLQLARTAADAMRSAATAPADASPHIHERGTA